MKRTALINDGKKLLIVDATLSQIGNQAPYFSITGEIWKANRNGDKHGRDAISCGCLHDEILSAFPDLKDLVDLHLSDMDGVPMHAIENSWYWNGGTKYQGYKKETLANYLRITEEEADQMHNTITDKNSWTEKVVAMFPRFKEEAQAAIAKYNLTVTKG